MLLVKIVVSFSRPPLRSRSILPKATEPPGTSTKGSLPGLQISSSHIPPSATNLRLSCFWQFVARLVGNAIAVGVMTQIETKWTM